MKKIYGLHTCTTFLQQHPSHVKQCCLLKADAGTRLDTIVATCREANIPIDWIDKKQFHTQLGDVVHQGISLAIEPLPTYSDGELKVFLEDNTNPFLLILDGLQDPHNLGACLRSACAAGVDAVIVPKDNAATLTPTVRKVACGAAEILPFFAVTNLARAMRQIQKAGIWIYGLAGEAEKTIYQTELQRPLALVAGSEHKGLRRLTRELCDSLANIPMPGNMESLNVSVATGIALFEVVRRKT